MGKDSRLGPRQKTKASSARARSSAQSRRTSRHPRTALLEGPTEAATGSVKPVFSPDKPLFRDLGPTPHVHDLSTSPSSRSSCATFNLSRVYPAAHKLQKLEMERLLAAARRVRKRYNDNKISEEVMTRFMQDPTRQLRRLVYFELGDLSWRQELRLREELEHGQMRSADELNDKGTTIVEAMVRLAANAPPGATLTRERVRTTPYCEHGSKNSRRIVMKKC